MGIKAQSIQSKTSENTLPGQSIAKFQSNVHLLAQETSNSNAPGVPRESKNLFEAYAESAKDPRFTQLQHYLSMLTAILKEIDQAKYCVEPPSRSRVRVAIHDTFDEEMHFLAHPFGDDWLKLVTDHFASLVAPSRDKLSSYAKPHDTLSSSSPFEVVGESAYASSSGTTQLNERSSSSSKTEVDLDNVLKLSYPSYPQASPSNYSRQSLSSRSPSKYTYPARKNEFESPYATSSSRGAYESSATTSGSSYTNGYGGSSESSLNAPSYSAYTTTATTYEHSGSRRADECGKVHPVVVEAPSMPRCWDHGCNGRQFSTFSALLTHRREKSGHSTKSVCHRCGAEFTMKTALHGHLAQDQCKNRPMVASEVVEVPKHHDLEQATQDQVAAIPTMQQPMAASTMDEEQRESLTPKQLKTSPKSTQSQARDPDPDLVEPTIPKDLPRQRSAGHSSVERARERAQPQMYGSPTLQYCNAYGQPQDSLLGQAMPAGRKRRQPDSAKWRQRRHLIQEEHTASQPVIKRAATRQKTQGGSEQPAIQTKVRDTSSSGAQLFHNFPPMPPKDYELTKENIEEPPSTRKRKRAYAEGADSDDVDLILPPQEHLSELESCLVLDLGSEKVPTQTEHSKAASGSIVENLVALWTLSSI